MIAVWLSVLACTINWRPMAPISGECMMDKEGEWFVGIDWGSQEHVVSLCDHGGRTIGRRKFSHGGTGLSDMVAWLLKESAGRFSEVHVAIETPHGPIVEVLLERGCNVYSINPKQLDRFRDRFTVAGAKDDNRDADVLADSLRTDMRAFRKLSSVDPTIVELREWSRIDEELKAEHVRLTNRLKHQLWRYYPQIYELADDVGAGWFLDLLEAVPTPEKATNAREKTIARILKQHRIRRFDAAHVLNDLRKPALAVAPGTIEAATAGIRILIARLRLINSQRVDAEQQLDRLCKKIMEPLAGEGETAPGQQNEQRDATILDSTPGIGRTVLVSLLTEASDALQRRDYHALRALCGTAPVTKRSGKSRLVLRRRACNRRLRNAVHHWAHNAVQRDATSRAKYEALRAKGHGHARALRSVADRLLNVVCAMLRSGTPFDSSFASKKQASA
jgi:transposase